MELKNELAVREIQSTGGAKDTAHASLIREKVVEIVTTDARET
jgi:hypothetical protein